MRLLRMTKNINKALVLIAGLFLFCSCQKKNESSVKPAEIKFSWWGTAPRAEYTKLGLKIFKNLYPEISVLPQGYLWAGYEEMFDRQMKSGSTADVMQINYNWLYKYSPDGEGFYDLNQLSKYIDLNNFTSDELEYGTKNGVLNAIPIGFNTIVPIYNKSFLEKYGVEAPSTWEDLIAAGRKMKSDDVYVLGAAGKLTFLFVIACYEQYFDKKVFKNNRLNLSDSEMEDLFLIYKRFVENHVCLPCDEYTRENFIESNNLAGVICWSNEISSYGNSINRKGSDYILGNMPFKNHAKESGFYIKPSMMYAIKKDTKNPEAAALLVDFLLNNGKMAILQENERGVPVSNNSIASLLESGHLNSLEYTASVQTRFKTSLTNKMLPIMEDIKVINAFSLYGNAVAQGRLSLQDAAKNFVKVIESVY